MFFDKGEVDGWGTPWETMSILLNRSFVSISLGFILGKLGKNNFLNDMDVLNTDASLKSLDAGKSKL